MITCPIRFRQDWIVAEHAAEFFFPPGTKWTSLTEVRLEDAEGKRRGNIDLVLVAYDDCGRVIDFGALEIQAVYISGNVRRPFEHLISSPGAGYTMDWSRENNYPRPDFLSSSLKRLVPQLLVKGAIFDAWGKKIAVALNESFFVTLPIMEEVAKAEAGLAWILYELHPVPERPEEPQRYQLLKVREVYTRFASALQSLTATSAGPVEHFIEILQQKLDEKLEAEPTNRVLGEG